MLSANNPYRFTWAVANQSAKTLDKIQFKFTFDSPELISKFAKDKIIIQILKPELLFPAFKETRYDYSFNTTTFELPPQAQSEFEANTS